MKNNKSLMVIDPAVVTPSIDSFNRISKVSPFNVTYHLPALYGTSSLHKEYHKDILGIIVLGSATSVNDKNQWQDEIEKIILDSVNNNIPILGLCYGHQLLGKIFGGVVEPLWKGEIKRGNRNVELKNSLIWGEAQSGLLLYSHQDGITQMPPNFNILGSSKMV
ncbi:MAG: type 1 glutamine amidotransferase, partial [Candidatus Neomarinimicrobiota bacterium]